MLGDLIYEAKGKIAGYRVLDAKGDPSETATWTGQGIAYYPGRKRRDVGSVYYWTLH
jgi:hypothetical protein